MGFGKLGEVAVSPVEGPAFHNHPGNDIAMPPQSLGGRVYHDIRPVPERIQQVGGGERIVDNQRDTVVMGHGGDLFDVQHRRIGITDAFDENSPRLGGDPPAKRLDIVGIGHLIDADAKPGIDPLEAVHRAAVEMRGRQDPAAPFRHTEQGIE